MALINANNSVIHFTRDYDRFSNDMGAVHIEVHDDPQITFCRTFNDKDYYVFEFREGEVWEAVDIREHMPPEFFARLHTGDSTAQLLLSNTHEAFLHVIRQVYDNVVRKYNIPPANVTLITGAFSADIENEKVAAELGLDKINIEIGMDFEFSAQCDLYYLKNDLKKPFPETLVDKPYRTSFLNLNRRWRPHRPLFVAMLKAYGLIDKGLVSFAPSDDERSWDEMWHVIMDKVTKSKDTVLAKTLSKHRDEIINMPPLYLDTEELVTNRAKFSHRNGWMYSSTYFSLVSETHYFKDEDTYDIFFSEKVFKPIAFKHPFILIAPHRSLSALKSLGYKTFDGLIDESYDSEPDDVKRMKMVLEETRRLDSLSGAELSNWLSKAKEICEYNYNVLYNKKVWYHPL